MIDNLQAVIARDEQRHPQDDEYPSDDRAYEENPLLSVVVFKAVGYRHRASEKKYSSCGGCGDCASCCYSFVVWVVVQYRISTIQLLDHHNTHQRVRKRKERNR